MAWIAVLALPLGWGARVAFEADVEDLRTVPRWPKVRGVIVESYVPLDQHPDHFVGPFVRYRYRVDGSTYFATGHKIDIAGGSEKPQDVVERYPVGAEVDVFFKPGDPGRSALEAAEFDFWDRSVIWLGVAARWLGAAALSCAIVYYLANRRALGRADSSLSERRLSP